jgi:hypothetical protein
MGDEMSPFIFMWADGIRPYECGLAMLRPYEKGRE